MMKPYLIGLALLSLTLTGCLDLDVRLKVDAKGRGEGSFRLEMPEPFYQLLKFQVTKNGSDLSVIESQEALEVEAREWGGVINRYRNVVVDGRRYIEIDGLTSNFTKSLEHLQSDVFSLTRQGDAWVMSLGKSDLGEAIQNMDGSMLEQQIRMLAANLKGMKWNVQMTVPTLQETNMSRSGDTARYSVNFDTDIADKSGKEAVDALKQMVSAKWVKFKLP